VVALSNSSGTTIQTYEYTVYGQVAAEDPNHPNPFLFTGRRFDIETGLYYYRARYYNPYIGRFLQTDPVGYGYGYCGNNPLGRVDPFGLLDTTIKVPAKCITEEDPEDVDWDDINWFLEEIGLGYYDYIGWTLYGYRLNDGMFEIDLIYTGKEDEDKVKVPTVEIADLEVREGSRYDILPGKVLYKVPIVILGGIARLTQLALRKIIEPAVQSVNTWSTGFGMERLNKLRLVLSCDTAFRKAEEQGLNTWYWAPAEDVFDDSDINFILEGHAMRHIGLSEGEALELVRRWERSQGHEEPSWKTLYWWSIGWTGYSTRANW